MKLFSIFLFIVVFGLCLENTSETEKAIMQKQIPVINKGKSYSKLTAFPKTEVTYVVLETKKDVLLGQRAHMYYVSEKRILIADWNRGDVFIFDMKGKIISHFNQKGGLGYTQISYAVYDEKNGDVYILDKVIRKISVFSEDGVFKRSFRMPHNLKFTKIENFDNNSLLAWHQHAMGKIEPEQKKPYLLISKKDGSIISKLNIIMNKANPRYLLSGNICYQLGYTAVGNCKFGNSFFLANMSMDTIYSLLPEKKMIPVFVQTPTVFSEHPEITGVVMRTNNFIVFSIYMYDLKAEKKRADSGKSNTDEVRFLMYNYDLKQFFECPQWKHVADEIDLPPNTSVKMLQAYRLVEHRKLGLLTGELKRVSKTLKFGDNPVIEVTKFK